MWKQLCQTAAVVGLLVASPAMADSFSLTGVTRDFKRGDRTGGHLDFETAHMSGRGGYGHVKGLVTMYLSDDSKPVYNPDRPNKDTIYSADTFNQWFRDTAEVNLSAPLTITLNNGEDTPGGVYTFHDSSFWPINGKMFGNQGLGKNFHFTFELHTKFNYTPGQEFTFIGDDDVWVYVNNVRVIDLGGVHGAINGKVTLFDGKAFVDKNDFPLSDVVLKVSQEMKNDLAAKWELLDLPGNCPVSKNDRYIDLDLNSGGPDMRVVFDSEEQITVRATAEINTVVLKFEDGSQQRFENLSGNSVVLAGTAGNDGKDVVGVWASAGGSNAYYSPTGGGPSSTLAFFFAERHTTQSNFRIDTTMNLESVEFSTVSPLYD